MVSANGGGGGVAPGEALFAQVEDPAALVGIGGLPGAVDGALRVEDDAGRDERSVTGDWVVLGRAGVEVRAELDGNRAEAWAGAAEVTVRRTSEVP